MSKFSAVLLASLLSLSAWSETTSQTRHRVSPAPVPAQTQPSILFQDPMLGTVKMRPVYTPSSKFGIAEKTTLVAEVQRPGVSVDQTKTVRPGSWR